jgi:hypothetical protein
MRCFLHIFLVLWAVACTRWEIPEPDKSTALADISIGDLKAYYIGKPELTITDDMVIAGRVVSSTSGGNFYNTFFIDDGTGAVEIMAGIYDTDAIYRPGQRVAVYTKGRDGLAGGLAVGWRDGAMQLGLAPEPGNRFPTGYFYHKAMINKYIKAEWGVVPVAPIDTSIADLTEDMTGRLVRIEGLRLDELSTAGSWATSKPEPLTGYVKFRSSPTDSITVVTSGYASFASKALPHGTVTLTGLLFHGKGGSSRDHYLLKLRDEKDIAF